ncbi:MAG: hypothetical protein M1816_005090 [Peltula sp. TS41687]|nr:MAG: hypothetical protein M1816_005090 [Peltula sp. TS41687]
MAAMLRTSSSFQIGVPNIMSVQHTLTRLPAKANSQDHVKVAPVNGGFADLMPTTNGQKNKEEEQEPSPWLKTRADKQQRRVPIACHLCRKKKVRCSGEQPTCGSCRHRGVACGYIGRLKKRKKNGTAFFDNASALGDEQEKKAEGNPNDGEKQSPPVNLQGILRSETWDRHRHVPLANSVHENTKPGNGALVLAPRQSELQAKQPSETLKQSRSTLDEQTDAMGGIQILGLSSTQAIDAAQSALPFYTNERQNPSWTPQVASNSDVNYMFPLNGIPSLGPQLPYADDRSWTASAITPPNLAYAAFAHSATPDGNQQLPQSTQAIDAARSALPFYTNERQNPSWTPQAALNSDVNYMFPLSGIPSLVPQLPYADDRTWTASAITPPNLAYAAFAHSATPDGNQPFCPGYFSVWPTRIEEAQAWDVQRFDLSS